MTNEVLPRAAGAEYLADVLRRAGVMGDGRLCNVEVDSSRRQLISRIIRLRLTYGSAMGAPSSLILKIGVPMRRDSEIGRREVEFYTQVARWHPRALFHAASMRFSTQRRKSGISCSKI